MDELYVLQLEGGRFYIGKSSDVDERVKQHKAGAGSEYTKLYKPKKLWEVREAKTSQDENNLTREYMEKYGVDNVRGGSYSQVNLPAETKRVLETEFRGNADACFKCGKSGHFASSCNNEEEDDVCERCGRNSHSTDDCYATTHFRGYRLDSDDEEDSDDEQDSDDEEDSEDEDESEQSGWGSGDDESEFEDDF